MNFTKNDSDSKILIGPTIGGLLTTKASWRWCFWINVPIGGLALIGILIFLPASPAPEVLKGRVKERIWSFDPIGNLLLAPGLIALLLALQWGGTKYLWSDPRIIALFVLGPVLLLGFLFTQRIQENGTIPPRIVRQRSIAASVFFSIGGGAALIIPTFYLPIWFQAIKGISAVDAGIRLLPLFLGTVVFVIGCGIAISRTGYYAPWLIVGCAIRMIGTGLLASLKVDSGIGEWVVFQVKSLEILPINLLTVAQLITGAGTGMTLQQCSIAAQTVLPKKDVPIGLTVIAFAQFFGGTIFVSVCQTILTNTLTSELVRTLPSFQSSAIINSGATDIQGLVSRTELPVVLAAYNLGLDNTFYCALAASSLAFVASFFIEWKSVKARS